MSTREWLPVGDDSAMTGNGAVNAFVGSYASDAGLRWWMEAKCCSLRRVSEFGFQTQADAQRAAERWLDETEQEIQRLAGQGGTP